MKTKVIAVHSFKGGTGKTTLTANLASTLALDHRVGVMDLDLSGPGLHVLFGLRKGDIKATLTDIFLGDASPADVVVDLSRKYGLSKGGLFFCPASNKVEDMLRLLKSGLEREHPGRTVLIGAALEGPERCFDLLARRDRISVVRPFVDGEWRAARVGVADLEDEGRGE